MPPKNKFTKEEITAAATAAVREGGLDALTARSVAKRLGASTQPIFAAFPTMDALNAKVTAAVRNLYSEYIGRGLAEEVPFFGVGMQYIRFAREEPEFYRLLFLRRYDGENPCIAEMERTQELVRGPLMRIYRIDADTADRYFRDMWLVAHSLATLTAMGCCPYGEREIGQILTGFSVSLCKAIKEITGFAAGTFDRGEIFTSLIKEGQK